jgi:ribonucleotide monophosphatase NagD (HAD superfamily)
VFFNGVLVENHFELKGETLYIGKPSYKIRRRAHQAAGAWRPQPADQLPEYLGQGTELDDVAQTLSSQEVRTHSLLRR